MEKLSEYIWGSNTWGWKYNTSCDYLIGSPVIFNEKWLQSAGEISGSKSYIAFMGQKSISKHRLPCYFALTQHSCRLLPTGHTAKEHFSARTVPIENQ